MKAAMTGLVWRIREFFFPEERPVVWWAWGGRAIVFAVVAVYGWSFFRTPIRDLGDDPRFIHNVHLVFHEAGHAIFGVFGNEFLQFAGGTLGQLLMPVVLLVAFRWKNRDAFGAALAAWMLGQSLVDCAPYINDARTLGLTLVGGHTGQEVEGHDWEYLLTHLNLLHKDVFIAHYVLLAGRWVMALSLLWAALELGRQFQRLGGGAASGGCDRL